MKKFSLKILQICQNTLRSPMSGILDVGVQPSKLLFILINLCISIIATVTLRLRLLATFKNLVAAAKRNSIARERQRSRQSMRQALESPSNFAATNACYLHCCLGCVFLATRYVLQQ